MGILQAARTSVVVARAIEDEQNPLKTTAKRRDRRQAGNTAAHMDIRLKPSGVRVLQQLAGTAGPLRQSGTW